MVYTDQLKLRGSTPKERYAAGEPISVKTELQNVTDSPQRWDDNPNAKGNCDISVIDDMGRYLREEIIGTGAPGTTVIISPHTIQFRESSLQGWPHQIYDIPPGKYVIVGIAPGWATAVRGEPGTILFRLPIRVVEK